MALGRGVFLDLFFFLLVFRSIFSIKKLIIFSSRRVGSLCSFAHIGMVITTRPLWVQGPRFVAPSVNDFVVLGVVKTEKRSSWRGLSANVGVTGHYPLETTRWRYADVIRARFHHDDGYSRRRAAAGDNRRHAHVFLQFASIVRARRSSGLCRRNDVFAFFSPPSRWIKIF